MSGGRRAWRAVLRDAAEWHLLALLLMRPTAAWRARLRELVGEMPDDALRSAGRRALDEAREGDYLTLLGPGGNVSPREVGYREVADPGRVLADLRAYHEAFVWSPCVEEPPDHVGVECSFVAYLKLKQAAALRQGEREAAEVTRTAAAQFLETHLAAFAEPLARQLVDLRAGYLAAAAVLLLQRVGPRPPLAEGGWVPEGLDGCGLECVRPTSPL